MMKHVFEINLEKNLLKETFLGDVDLDTLEMANNAIISDPLFKKGMNFLSDFCKANINMNYLDMLIHTSKLPSLGVNKQVFIVSNDHEFGMLRMFESLSEDKDLYKKVRVFRELEEGLKWLNS